MASRGLLAIRGQLTTAAGACCQGCCLLPPPKPPASPVAVTLGRWSLWLPLEPLIPSWWHCDPPQGHFHCRSVSSWNVGGGPVERSTSTPQSCHSGVLRRCCIWQLTMQGGTPVLTHCCAWIALLKWTRVTFSHVLCCPFICCYQCSSVLCLGCLRAILSEKSILPPVPRNWAGGNQGQTPRSSQNCLSSSEYRSLPMKQACGIVLLFLGRIF